MSNQNREINPFGVTDGVQDGETFYQKNESGGYDLCVAENGKAVIVKKNDNHETLIDSCVEFERKGRKSE